MSRKRNSADSLVIQPPAWMLTFSDLLTLMLTFFVLRYALGLSSQHVVPESNTPAPTIVSPNSDSKLAADYTLALKQNAFIEASSQLNFAATVNVSSFAQSILRNNKLALIESFWPSNSADSLDELSSERLSSARALAAFRQLVDAGLPPERIWLSSTPLPQKDPNLAGTPLADRGLVRISSVDDVADTPLASQDANTNILLDSQ